MHPSANFYLIRSILDQLRLRVTRLIERRETPFGEVPGTQETRAHTVLPPAHTYG